MDGELTYTISEISKRKGTPYIMSNEKLADFMFPYIKNVFPEAELVKTENSQCIMVSKRARTLYVKKLRERKTEYEKKINEMDNVIEILSKIK